MKLNRTLQQGNTLIIAVMLVAVVSTMVGVGALFNSSIMNNVHRSAAILEAGALADGALEALFAEWRTRSSDRPTNVAGTPPRLSNVNAPNMDGVTNGYVQLIKPGMLPSSDGSRLEFVPMAPGVQADRALLTGRVLSPVYRGFATVSLSTPFGDLEMDVSQVFRYEGAAPTDWALIDFTVPRTENGERVSGSLPIHPGAEMRIGRTHANYNLWNHSTNLHYEGATTHGGTWENTYEPLDPRYDPNSQVQPNYRNDLPPVRGDRQSFFDIDPTQLELGVNISDRNSNPNDDGYREMLKKRTDLNQPDPLNSPGRDSMRPYDQSAIRVEVNSDTNAMRVFNSAGMPVASSDALYQTVAKAINPSLNVSNVTGNFTLPSGTFSTFRDNRISTSNDVKVTNLNVAVLKTALEGGLTVNGNIIIPDLSNYNFNPPAAMADAWADTRPNANGWNGAIHIEDITAKPAGSSASPAKHRGVRLTQGGQIPKLKRGDGTFIGMTVVSPNPAYVLGDFNTGSTYTGSDFSHTPTLASKPDSNGQSGSTLANFDGNKRIVHGYQDGTISNNPMIPPASIMADAVTILSNAWQDSNSTKTLNNRTAAGTTVNAAFMSGVVPTGARDFNGNVASYSGGAENFPRFLESWSNRNFVYHGSMIMAFESEQAFFRWRDTGNANNVYNAPRRFWFHEANFRTVVINGVPVNNPPPLMPQRLFSFPRAPKVIERVAFN